MMTNTFSEPVSKLVQLGLPHDPWQDYLVMGIMSEHIPELLHLVEDNDLRWLVPPDDLPEEEDLPDWYAQVHSWRALGQLKAQEAIPALIGILQQIDNEDDDWLSSDAPSVFGLIGEA